MKNIYLLLLAVAIAFSACRSPEKLTNQGRYDLAIEVAAKRLKKNRSKAKFTEPMHRAFTRAHENDMRYIESLKGDAMNDEKWQIINDVYLRMKRRQNIVNALLPLNDRTGKRLEFKFVKVDEMLTESRTKAAEELYISGLNFMTQAEKGDRFAARNAYGKFEAIGQYYSNYKDVATQKNRAIQLGTTEVAFRVVNNTNQIMPANFEKMLLQMNIADLNKNWVHYDLNPSSSKNYDYKIALNLKSIVVSPEQMNTREYTDEKSVQDGVENVIGANGQPVRDSTGHITTRPRYIKVRATVLENLQRKAAQVGGFLEYYDASNRQLKSLPITTESVFENYAATFRGDDRALSDDSRRKIGNQPRPFPAAEALILQSTDNLKGIVIREMTSNSSIIQ